MRALAAVVCVAGMICLSNCTPSLHPLYGEKDTVFDPGLIGKWGEAEDKTNEETWQFEKFGDNAYTLILNETNKKARSVFRVHLVRLGSRTFFDAILQNRFVDGVEVDESDLIPPHWFGRLSRQGDSLNCALLDADWLKQAIAANRVRVRHEMLSDGAIILTAPTKELQSLVLKLADDEKAFPWGEPLVRKK